MSTTNKPLSYEASQILLQYVRPDLRVELSNRCPGIKTADRTSRLTLKHLMFGNGTTKVDNVTYKVEIVQYVRPGETIPEYDRSKELVFPLQRDVDENGFYNPSSINDTTPGDLNLRDDLNQDLPEVEWKYLEEEKDLENTAMKICDDKGAEERRARLQQYRRRKQGISPNYKFYLKFSIISENRQYVENLEYNRRIHEAVKHMNCKLFGGRRKIFVDSLAFEDSKYIFRLPVGFKCEVKHLKCDSIDIALLENVVQFSDQYTLSVLYNWENDFVHSKPGYKNANQLTFFVDNELMDYQELKDLDYENVHFEHMSDDFLCIDFIRNWLDNGKSRGTRYSFGMQSEESANICVTKIYWEFRVHVLRRHNRYLIFRITNGISQLKVTKKRMVRSSTIKGYMGCEWCLCLKVESRQTF